MSGQNHSQEETPLKKSRYMWEVKGKHHLKKPIENNKNVSNSSYPEPSTSSVQLPMCKDVEASMTSAHINSANLSYTRERDEDYFMQQWHAKQLATSFMDNTINTVLEKWVTTPLDAYSIEERPLNCSNDGNLENDAILMAIQSHGLRGTEEYSSNDTFVTENLMNSYSDSIRIVENPICSKTDQERDSKDFFHNAVSAAIQEKGLSYGCS